MTPNLVHIGIIHVTGTSAPLQVPIMDNTYIHMSQDGENHTYEGRVETLADASLEDSTKESSDGMSTILSQSEWLPLIGNEDGSSSAGAGDKDGKTGGQDFEIAKVCLYLLFVYLSA